MNRRTALKASLGVLAVGLASQTCSEVAKADEPPNNALCPLAPAAFHGTYTTYYGGVYNNTTKMCGSYQSFDGANNLTCGCGGAGCQLTVDRNYRTAGALTKLGLKKKRRDDSAPTLSLGVELVDDFHRVIFFKTKPSGGRNVRAKLFRLRITPKELDSEIYPGAPKDETPPFIDLVGYEITEKIPPVAGEVIAAGITVSGKDEKTFLVEVSEANGSKNIYRIQTE